MPSGFDVLMLVIGAAAVAALARRVGLPAPLALTAAGLAASYVPGVPSYALNPHIVLVLFLPPLLYSAALTSSYVGFRANIRPIALLSVGLVLFTTAVLGLAVHALVPGLPLAAAFALGAIVAPPDAVAATAIGRRLGLPRRVVTILAGESLVNDATALTVYRVAVAAAVGESISALNGVGEFAVAAAGGVAVGLVLAPLVHWLRVRLRDYVLENMLSLITPFVAYLAAEEIHASGVLAVVVVGLYLGHRSSETSFAVRLQEEAVWRMVDFVLESVVFALIGLQLRLVAGGALGTGDPVTLATYAAVALLVVVAARVFWVFPATYLPRWLSARVRARDPTPPWQVPAVISWAGMRGVVSLAAAFALPAEFPARGLVLLLTFVVVIGTLMVQGLTLPALIRRLGLYGREDYTDRVTEAAAQQEAGRAALERLDVLLTEDGDPPAGVVDRLRRQAEARQLGAWERLGRETPRETPSAAYRRLRREMLTAERATFVRMRDERRIDDEVLRRVMRELDLEEAMLERE